MTTPLKPRSSLKAGSVKQGKKNNPGLENILLTQSKQKRFLDLLAAQRIKNSPGQFHDIDLSHVDLSDVDLTDIDLTGANLTNTNLSGAKLIRTNLTNAKLIRTMLSNTNLTDVILTNAIIDKITQCSIQQAFHQRWYEAAHQSIDNFSQKWEKLKSAEGFNAFETVLKQLNECNLKNSITTSEITEVIESVIKSPDIRRLTFQVAQGVDVNCYAHLLTVFNTAQGLTRFDKLLHTNAKQHEILALAKGMVRQNLLDETTLPVMRQQWSEGRRECNGQGTGPSFNEALKVQLALRHQLAMQLKLPCPIKNPMNATEIARLNNSDKEFAVDFVNTYMNDQEQIIDALICLPSWQLYLERILGKQVVETDADEPCQMAIESLLRRETEKIVCADA